MKTSASSIRSTQPICSDALAIPGYWFDADFSNPEQLMRLVSNLPPGRRTCIQRVSQRLAARSKAKPKRDTEDPYEPNAAALSLITMAAEHKVARRVAWCGTRVKGKRQFCGKWKLCACCSYLKRWDAWHRYVPAFRRGNFYKLDVSFNRSTTEWETAFGLADQWGALGDSLRKAHSAGLISGAFWVEEIHVEQLVPYLKCLPHIHATIHADNLDEEELEEAIKASVWRDLAQTARWCNCQFRSGPGDVLRCSTCARGLGRPHASNLREQPPAARRDTESRLPLPTVKLKRLRANTELSSAIGYLIKPMRIVKRYREAYCAAPRGEVWRVNAALGRLFELLESECEEAARNGDPRGRVQLHAFGTLKSGRNRTFIGARPCDKEENRAYVAGVLKEAWNSSGTDLGE